MLLLAPNRLELDRSVWNLSRLLSKRSSPPPVLEARRGLQQEDRLPRSSSVSRGAARLVATAGSVLLGLSLGSAPRVAITSRTARRCLVLRHDAKVELPAPSFARKLFGEDGELEVSLLQGLFQQAELQELVRVCEARNGFQASLQRTSSGEFRKDRMRTSSSCPMLWPLFTPPERVLQLRKENASLAAAVEEELAAVLSASKRCAEVIGVDPARVEPLQLIRYAPGQYYRPHMDTHEEPRRMSSYAGEQRSHTLLVFMSDIPEEDGGGHLHFPELGLRILPRAGDAVLWPNLTDEGVNLVDYDVEVMAFVSDGVDELAVAAGAARADLVGKGPELLVLGLRCSSTGCCRVPFSVQKGDLLSRADDTVALCLAQMASAVLRRGDMAPSSGGIGYLYFFFPRQLRRMQRALQDEDQCALLRGAEPSCDCGLVEGWAGDPSARCDRERRHGRTRLPTGDSGCSLEASTTCDTSDGARLDLKCLDQRWRLKTFQR
ncbi:P4HA1 [Symbiodinium sp. KB8]|nr:P4HA1 [Symbiodinium sp. KB8]